RNRLTLAPLGTGHSYAWDVARGSVFRRRGAPLPRWYGCQRSPPLTRPSVSESGSGGAEGLSSSVQARERSTAPTKNRPSCHNGSVEISSPQRWRGLRHIALTRVQDSRPRARRPGLRLRLGGTR